MVNADRFERSYLQPIRLQLFSATHAIPLTLTLTLAQ